MTAPYKYKSEPWTKVCTSEDWTKSVLDLLGGRNGITGEFKYSTLGIHILSTIITKVSNMTTLEFANKYLFKPLGIKEKNYIVKNKEEHISFVTSKTPKENGWFCDNKGIVTSGFGLYVSAEDLAKVGQMCLNKGICHAPYFVFKGTEDMVDEYHNYWFHIKGSLIGEVLALVICAIVGLVIQFVL